MKKRLLLFLSFILIIILTLVLGYQLNKQANTDQNIKYELEITIEGGGRITRHNIEKIIIFTDQDHELEYLKITYNETLNQEELYNLDRVINLNYRPEIKKRITFKPLSALETTVRKEN